MATFYSVQGQKYQNGLAAKNIAKRADGGQINANGHYVDTFTIPTGFATNDLIVLAPLPKGAIVRPTRSDIHASANPAATSIAFVAGDAADDDEFSAAVTVNAKGTFPFTGGTDQGGLPVAADGVTPIQFKATVTGAVTVGAVLTFIITYALTVN